MNGLFYYLSLGIRWGFSYLRPSIQLTNLSINEMDEAHPFTHTAPSDNRR